MMKKCRLLYVVCFVLAQCASFGKKPTTKIVAQTYRVSIGLDEMTQPCHFDDDSNMRMVKTTDPNSYLEMMVEKTRQAVFDIQEIDNKLSACHPEKEVSILYAKDMGSQCDLKDTIKIRVTDGQGSFREEELPQGTKQLNPGVMDVVKVLAPVIKKLPCEQIKVAEIQIILSPKTAQENRDWNQKLRVVEQKDKTGQTKQVLRLFVNPGQFECGLQEETIEKALSF